jgi:hypothetical protein
MVHHQMHYQNFHALPIGGAFGSFVSPLVSSSPLATCIWVLALDPFGAFHLGLPRPCLYLGIPFVLRQEVYLTFCLPLDRLT